MQEKAVRALYKLNVKNPENKRKIALQVVHARARIAHVGALAHAHNLRGDLAPVFDGEVHQAP